MKIFSALNQPRLRPPPRLSRPHSPRLCSERRASWLPGHWVLTAIVVGLAGGLLFCFDPSRYSGYPHCLFHEYTGLLCPGCGGLRALHQLLHGHVEAAFRLNALLLLSLPLVGAWGAVTLRRSLLEQPAPSLSRAWFWSGVLVVVLFGILRNLPFAHGTWLVP